MSDQLIKDDSRFIHGEDLQRDGKPCNVTLTIKEVGDKDTMKAKDGKVIEGFPVWFVETDKIAVLRGCNIRLLKTAMGTSDRSKMVGRKLTLEPRVGDWFGQKNVLGVRVHIPSDSFRPFIAKQQLGRKLTED